jgi:hypothetical protein
LYHSTGSVFIQFFESTLCFIFLSQSTQVFTAQTSFNMSDFKDELDVQARDAESQEDVVVSKKKGTPDDQRDMHRMGKKQELRRNFGFVSIFGYSMILMATWETALT